MDIPVVGIYTKDQKLNGALLQGLGLAYSGVTFHFTPLEMVQDCMQLTVVRPSGLDNVQVKFLVFDVKEGLRNLRSLASRFPMADIVEVSTNAQTVNKRSLRAVDHEWAHNAQNWEQLFSSMQPAAV